MRISKWFGSGFRSVLWVVALLVPWVSGVYAQTYGLGDIPLDPAVYDSHLKVWAESASDSLPTSYDARTDGLVTSPKNQGACGSCWAFASVGAMESHLIKECGAGPSDLSEQQQVSCNRQMNGCCGGSLSALQFWQLRGPIEESCGPYGEGSTSCPVKRTVPCSDMSGCSQLGYRVVNWHTIVDDPAQMKTSLYNDGPSYWRYDVYSDFSNFWSGAASGSVYVNQGGAFSGGHAVLLIGWDDAKQAYLCKNSWGARGGPQGDGTFWIAYSGHAHDLNFQMANFDLTCGWASAYPQLAADPDDIALLREFRERVLRAQPDGRLVSEILYRHSDEALAVLSDSPQLMRKASRLIEGHREAVNDVLSGKEGAALDSREVIDFLRRFGRRSPPMLRLLTAMVVEEMVEKRAAGELFYGFSLE